MYMCSTNRSNTILHKKIVFGFIAISIGVVENSGSTGLISSTASKHTDLRTSLKYMLMVSPEC